MIYKNIQEIKFILIGLIIVVFLGSPLTALALDLDSWLDNLFNSHQESAPPSSSQSQETSQNTQVITNVKVKADTGGNSPSGGQVETGSASAQVSVENVVDGQEQEPINIELEAGPGETKQVEIKNNQTLIQAEATAENDDTLEPTLEPEPEAPPVIQPLETQTPDIQESEKAADSVTTSSAYPSQPAVSQSSLIKTMLSNIFNLFKKIFKLF